MDKSLLKIQESFIKEMQKREFYKSIETKEKLFSKIDAMIEEFVKPVLAYDESVYERTKLNDSLVNYVLLDRNFELKVDNDLVTLTNIKYREEVLRVNYSSGKPQKLRINYSPELLTLKHMEDAIAKCLKDKDLSW
ncbi:hypothetical protein [Caryophanon tenue]|uniref:Uncharacterized protein n=1 Tax=Caryophanon tenue TaxID=33978 RepID=A0A1C0Y554_9BACL|nr:hypothetical protein [Caryophanon tenue]OCS82266.1 hypothetical protein A6M13_07470 [Caryophanon tenue]